MSSHIKRMKQAAVAAAVFRSENSEGFAHILSDGYVLLWRMKASGWTSELDHRKVRPGVLAVNVGGTVIFQATGGTYQNGATEFSAIYGSGPK